HWPRGAAALSPLLLLCLPPPRGARWGAADHVDVAVGPLAVRSRRLAGGRRDGVLLVELVAGTTKVFVLPDRGLGIWKIMAGAVELGWQSPVHGPVHPRFVPLGEPSGIGWLDGFDELVARCGLVSNGAPDFDESGRLRHGLHGRIANLPAHHLDVTLDDSAGTITLTGAVDETRFLVHALRMTTSLTLHADRQRVSWTDTVRNISDRPAGMQMLYHVNFGPPLLGPNAELVAAVEELAPRDAAAAADVATWNRYAAPKAGRGEECHFMRHVADEKGMATAMLVAPEGRHAACLSWKADTLPCFTLWKNQGGLADGYVTGLEPATNYPNPRSFEEAQKRVVPLAPNASVRFDLAIEHVSGTAVEAARSRIAAVAAGRPTVLHREPHAGWSRR
ncbi:MAG: DUF4432 family protein, partial [Planctomycetia bacterium]